AHWQIDSPADEKACCHRDGDEVICGRPNQILDHFSVGSTREFDRSYNVSWITTHEHDSSGLNRYISSRADCNSNVCGRQRWCVVHAVTHHCDTLAALLKALHRRSLVSRKHLR